MIKLLAFGVLATAVVAERLQSNYLPPLSAKTAGGGSFLSAPQPAVRPTPVGAAPAFTASGIATSYAAPPSGPVPSGLYGAPTTRSTGTPVAILRFDNENNGDGTYRFEYQTENKISQQEQGRLQNAESSVVRGSYSYEAPNGQTITVEYVADGDGFRASGEHIPTPPPIPEAIRRSLKVNAAAERSGYSSSSFAGATASLEGAYQQPQVTRQYLAPTAQPAGYRY